MQEINNKQNMSEDKNKAKKPEYKPLLDPRFVGDDICWVKGTRNRTDNEFRSVNFAAEKLSPEELEDLIGICC